MGGGAVGGGGALAVTVVPRLARRLGLGLTQVLLGAAAIVGLAVLLGRSAPGTPPPQGWRVLRPPGEVSALALQGDTVWTGGRDGLVAFDRRTAEVKPLPSGEPGLRYVSDLLADRQGALWVAHQSGLARFDGSRWQALGPDDGLPAGPATAVYQERSGAIWVGVTDGVVRYDPEYDPGARREPARRRYTSRDGLGLATVDVIYQDRQGALWLGSASPNQGGLARFDGEGWRTYSTRDGLVHPSVNGILEDRQGVLWVATGFADLGGASYLKGGVWGNLTRRDGLAGEKVRSVFEDRDGRLWLGSEYDGIAVLDGGRWRVLTPNDGLSGWEVKEMLQDEDGVYWLGTEDGLTRIEGLD